MTMPRFKFSSGVSFSSQRRVFPFLATLSMTLLSATSLYMSSCRFDPVANVTHNPDSAVPMDAMGFDAGAHDSAPDSGVQDASELCGNHQIDQGEECDGTDLAGKTCQSVGLEAGILACTADCTLDLRGCPGCGNGVAEQGELCDRGDLRGWDCNGPLTCTNDCLIDATACRVDTAGDGSDGDLVVTQTLDISQTDAPVYAVLALGNKDMTLQEPAQHIVPGDDVLLIDLQGCPGVCDKVGRWEIGRVESVNGATVVLVAPIRTLFGSSGDNSDLSCQHLVVQRLPRYRRVEVHSGGVLTTAAWDGTKGGLLAIRASEQIVVEAGGRITADGLGYRGGPGRTHKSQTGWPGESTCGPASQAGTDPNMGGGGGGILGTSRTDTCGQGGGGGGYGSPGSSMGFAATCIDRDNGPAAQNAGNTYGQPDLSTMFLGSGGGSGATDDDSPTSGTGGRGGGIILLITPRLILDGDISTNGTDGTAGSDHTDSGNGGGGSGGSLWLHVGLFEGTGTAQAMPGLGLATLDPDWNSPGGDGGTGRVRIDYQQAGNFLFGTDGAQNWLQEKCTPAPDATSITLQ